MVNLIEGVEKIKFTIESAIRANGEAGKKKVINSSQTISILHEVVKNELIAKGCSSFKRKINGAKEQRNRVVTFHHHRSSLGQKSL